MVGKKTGVLFFLSIFIVLFAATANAVPPDGVDIISPPGGAPVDGTIPVEIIGMTLQSQSPLPFDVFVCPTGVMGPGAPRAIRDAAGCTTITDHQPGPIGPDGLSEPMPLGTWDTTNEPQFPTDSFFDVFLEVYTTDPQNPVNEQLVDHDSETNIQVIRPDKTIPVINSVELNHPIVDTEYYQSGGGSGYKQFFDHKCTVISVLAEDDRDERLLVLTNVGAVLEEMFADVSSMPSFSESAWEEYLAMDMHSTPTLELNFETGKFEYELCPQDHIYHLYDNGVISYDDLRIFITQKLKLGSFALPVSVFDSSENHAESSVTITIVDYTVPTETGWNLRSTPFALDGDTFFVSTEVDAVLRWNSETQLWELVIDGRIVPMEALYMHATDRTQFGIVVERDVTAPPVAQLNKGWNLVGVAIPLDYDYLYNPEDYGYLTYAYSSDICVGEAFDSIVYNSDGNRAVDVVLSPEQSLSYSEDNGYWTFQQYQWLWVPDIRNGGASPRNQCSEKESGNDAYVQNFAGYWVFMGNADSLPGFTTTPLQLYSD